MVQTTENNKIDLEKLPDENLVRGLDFGKKVLSKQMIVGAVAIILAGVISGFGLSVLSSQKASSPTTSATGKSAGGKTVGSKDTKTFPDTTEGELEAGGLNGEGTHKLIRPGGESQTVYLTSSVLDLKEFEGKKVRVWGQTYAAKKAGWLMDVGRVEVL